MICCSLIQPGLYVGNVFSAIGDYKTLQESILEEKSIHVVISALTEEEYTDFQLTDEDLIAVDWYRLVIDDDTSETINHHFIKVHAIIKGALQANKNVLVHCVGGISRSPTLVLAYYMIEYKWSYEKAFAYVKRQRPIIKPNKGFVSQLKKLEHILDK